MYRRRGGHTAAALSLMLGIGGPCGAGELQSGLVADLLAEGLRARSLEEYAEDRADPARPLAGYRGGRYGDINALFFLLHIAGRDISYPAFVDAVREQGFGPVEFSDPGDGQSAAVNGLLDVGRRIGLRPAIRRVTREELERVPLPAILHLESSGPDSGRLHVVTGFADGMAWVTDCRSLETEQIPRDELVRAWSGFVVVNQPVREGGITARIGVGAASASIAFAAAIAARRRPAARERSSGQ